MHKLHDDDEGAQIDLIRNEFIYLSRPMKTKKKSVC